DPPPRSVAQLPGSMYPTAMRYPGPANARTLRNHDRFGAMGMLRCASGSDGIVMACRHGEAGASAAAGAGSEASDLDSKSAILTIVKSAHKLRLTRAGVNSTVECQFASGPLPQANSDSTVVPWCRNSGDGYG